MIEVTYIDHCGSDLTTVNAARVSFGKKSKLVEGEVKQDEHGEYLEMVLSDKDKKLIHYLAKHKHLSPFGHAFASFHVHAPIFVARQLVKHKFLRWNEISRRYVDEEPEFYLPNPFRFKAEDKKQGSIGNANSVVMQDKLDLSLVEHMEKAKKLYAEMIRRDIAPELARAWLPQATFTEWYWSGSLDAFAAMCSLRLKDDTQYETRLVAQQISEKMGELYPVSWEALMEHE